MGRTPSKPVAKPDFGHSPETIAFWRRQTRSVLNAGGTTPFYLFSSEPVAEALARLDALELARPVVHWLSTKTQPLPALLNWWRRQGRPAEVVSELEFRQAMEAGFETESILVNGPAKHAWLPAVSRPGLRVNFDSLRELTEMFPLARRDCWRVGLRLCTSEEYDSEAPEFPTQFGLTPGEAGQAVGRLKRAGLPVETLHFHLRTQVASADCYGRALNEVAAFAEAYGLELRHLDVGGGWPARHTLGRGGRRLDAGFSAAAFALVVRQAMKRFPTVEQLWMENGRHVAAGSGVLVITVLDVKERRGLRQLICDGGRTLNALVSVWEQHELLPLERRTGAEVVTAVYGPTCMAFDQLGRRAMPRSIRPGDRLIWFDAGAYHLPWETRFSHDLAEVWWQEGRDLQRVRARSMHDG